MSKTPKTQSVPSPQFVIFDPPIEGYEARAEVRHAKRHEHYILDGKAVKAYGETTTQVIVLTPVKRIEDLLPVLRCDAWAAQDSDGEWFIYEKKPTTTGGMWQEDGMAVADKAFNPFGLPNCENPDWKSQLYHFTPAQGWKKVINK